MNKIALFILGEKGYNVLSYILSEHKELLSHVVYGRDGGLSHDFHHEIIEMCSNHAIPCVSRNESMNQVCNFNGYIIAIGWRWMLKSGDMTIIIHDSLLPKYRGFSPLVNCLINGERLIGATALFAADKYDVGEIIEQASAEINYPITISEAIKIMSSIYVDLVRKLINRILFGKLVATIVQDESIASYSIWRDERDYWIDWSMDAERISRFIDAVGDPYQGARCLVNGEEVILHKAIAIKDEYIEDRLSSVGKVIFMDAQYPILVCKSGLLKVIELASVSGESMLPLTNFRTRFDGRVCQK